MAIRHIVTRGYGSFSNVYRLPLRGYNAPGTTSTPFYRPGSKEVADVRSRSTEVADVRSRSAEVADERRRGVDEQVI